MASNIHRPIILPRHDIICPLIKEMNTLGAAKKGPNLIAKFSEVLHVPLIQTKGCKEIALLIKRIKNRYGSKRPSIDQFISDNKLGLVNQ